MYNPWLALATTLAVLALMSTPLFRAADAPPADGHARQQAVDGLRGFAAFGVFLHHALITHDYIDRGLWQLPPSRFFAMAGQVGVSVFFLITGYLFWSKMLRERGQPRWVALYLGRVFRIAPVYTCAVLAMALIVFARGGWTAAESPWTILGELARWLSLGILDGPALDGDRETGIYLAGVTWSLQYEWAFYAALPVLSHAARSQKRAIPAMLALILGCLAWRFSGGPFWLGPSDPIFAALFVGGMTCATVEARGLRVPGPPWLLSMGGLCLLATTFAGFPTAYAVAPTLLLTAFFALVLSGGDLFGGLVCRAARRLGDVSFGIYMLQGPVLTAVFHPQIVRTHVLASKSVYWAAVLVAAATLVALATLAHRWLERPGIRGGRRFIGLLAARRPTPAPAAAVGAGPVRR